MKKKLLILVLLLCKYSSEGGTIIGTPHDLSNRGWGTTETCKFCHTPHASKNIENAPLWNRNLSVATYTLYTSPSFKGVSTQTQPNTPSKLCLSCHDGTVALDSYSGNEGNHYMTTSTALIGGNGKLNRDHPISFDYNAALVAENRTLVTPTSTKFVDGVKIIPLYDGKMECASCHEPHDNEHTKFLRVNNNNSALCFKCHIK